jgi:hypothetical protein
VQRNRNPQLRLRALQEIAASRDAEAFDTSIDIMGGWPRDERREGVKIMLQALAERRIGRRDQANAWIWRMAEYTREVHEEYAVQRWPETKRLLGLLVNSSGSAHARNARRLVHASRKEDRRLSAALLAAALAHTPEAEEALRGARTRMARKPAALARELLRNFPKGRRSSKRRRRKSSTSGAEGNGGAEARTAAVTATVDDDALDDDLDTAEDAVDGRDDDRRGDERDGDEAAPTVTADANGADGENRAKPATPRRPRRSRSRSAKPASGANKPASGSKPAADAQPDAAAERSADTTTGDAPAEPPARKPARTRTRKPKPPAEPEADPTPDPVGSEPPDDGRVDPIKRPRRRRTRSTPPADAEEAA